MKLKNKINLYTAVLFSILLLLMNLSVYFLFSSLMVNSQLDIAKSEAVKTSEAFNQSLGTIPDRDLLRAYVPINGMIRIVKKDLRGPLVTSQTEQSLSKQKAVYYTGEVTKKLKIGQNSYIFNSMPIILQDGNVANLQILKNIDITMDIIKTLRIVLTAVTILALIPAFISSSVLSKLITNPVATMIKTMRDIKESGHFKRLPLKVESKDELYQMGETFNHMIDLLESNFEKQKLFVSNASHELKTPLTIIESYASLLKRRGANDPKLFEESIEAIHSEAIRMKEMTEQLLMLAKHHEGWNINRSHFNLVELVQQTVKNFQSAYHRKIVLDGDVLSNITIQTDEQKLKQLLFIFLDNARKYSDDLIMVSLGKEREEVCIRIMDHGIGISEDELSKVFDRFYRVDKARSRKSGGTGLGLPLAKEIAEAIGVRVTLESKEGIGTTVSLYIQL
ncbi:HAMP domain-containing sensor histidine kinase [Neobacillus mesonae]|uniref:sensor histidine kinase n=1 Tax=Neobacillus mesonae TaxID=1193713 RepID=UPI002E22060A|nr:HAMP domain-containing sensor histidine kinase [Neobacillus mesonae]